MVHIAHLSLSQRQRTEIAVNRRANRFQDLHRVLSFLDPNEQFRLVEVGVTSEKISVIYIGMSVQPDAE